MLETTSEAPSTLLNDPRFQRAQYVIVPAILATIGVAAAVLAEVVLAVGAAAALAGYSLSGSA